MDTNLIQIILLVAAIICFVVQAFTTPRTSVNLVALGLAFVGLALLVPLVGS